MARPSKKKALLDEKPIKEENIKGIAALKREFQTGKMPERKLIALRTKLIDLFNKSLSSEDEAEFMEQVLIRDRARHVIAAPDAYVLHKIESDRCEMKCVVIAEAPPQVHHLSKGLECKYFYDSDDDRHIVYVPRTVPPEHQMTRDLVLKEQRGHFPSEEEYPKAKILWHRLSLVKKEFDAWFSIVDEDILTNTPTVEMEYKF